MFQTYETIVTAFRYKYCIYSEINDNFVIILKQEQRNMKITIFQFCPDFGNKKSNLELIAAKAKELNGDIILFPELCTTGYDFKNRDETLSYAEEFGGESVSIMQEIASDTGKIICFGFAEKNDDKIYNSCALLFPEKQYSDVYRKTHLFFRERFCFDETDKGFFVVDYKPADIKIGPMICYDWRFPEAARTVAMKGADLILCPSNLVTEFWHVSTPSRALENKVYLAVANRIGVESRNEKDLVFNGASKIYDYNGTVLAEASQQSEEIISAEISPLDTRDKSFNEFII